MTRSLQIGCGPPRHPELVEAYANRADRRDANGQMALFTSHYPFRGVHER
jgi:hypothetical protein